MSMVAGENMLKPNVGCSQRMGTWSGTSTENGLIVVSRSSAGIASSSGRSSPRCVRMRYSAFGGSVGRSFIPSSNCACELTLIALVERS